MLCQIAIHVFLPRTYFPYLLDPIPIYLGPRSSYPTPVPRITASGRIEPETSPLRSAAISPRLGLLIIVLERRIVHGEVKTAFGPLFDSSSIFTSPRPLPALALTPFPFSLSLLNRTPFFKGHNHRCLPPLKKKTPSPAPHRRILDPYSPQPRPSMGTPLLLLLLLTLSPLCSAIRSFPAAADVPRFAEAPEYRNGQGCPAVSPASSSCDPSLVHIAMTLDSEYLRGSIAAVQSVLRHASCPENVFFHFVAAEFDPASPRVLTRLVRSTFPSLSFKVYIFREDAVINLISSSVRQALENPLNYARNYLGDILDPCVDRVIYLDSDLVVVDDIRRLWETPLRGSRVIGAPEYCHANFTKYFTDGFWSDPVLSRAFGSRVPCYFNTGVMVMDLARWREGGYRKRIEGWMEVQRRRRIYELGSLPPFLLVFGGNVEAIDHRWNQHGLGGDNVRGSCRSLHPGPVSLLHWSGKGKPWVRLDERRPCPLDHLWEPYDLYSKRGGKSVLGLGSGSGSPPGTTLIGYTSYLV